MEHWVNWHLSICNDMVMVEWFEKFSLKFSISSFVIRVNLLHP